MRKQTKTSAAVLLMGSLLFSTVAGVGQQRSVSPNVQLPAADCRPRLKIGSGQMRKNRRAASKEN
ncbi:MAG: hypothetical protein WKF71_01250 [Pyrinomonadaceae bacterium]